VFKAHLVAQRKDLPGHVEQEFEDYRAAGRRGGHEMRVEDRDGNRLFEDDPDPAVLLGVSPVGHF